MDKTIKTRSVVKDIKVLDKRAAGLSAVKSAYAKTKEIAEKDGGEAAKHRGGTDYAQAKTEQAARGAAHVARQGAAGSTKKAASATREAHKAARDAKQGTKATGQATNAAHQQAKGTVGKPAAGTVLKQAARAASTANQAAKHQAIRTTTTRQATTVTTRQATAAATSGQPSAAAGRQATANTAGSAKTAVKQSAKGAVKAASKSVKTARATAKTAVKTSRHAAQATRASAKAAKITARSTAQAARAAGRATATAVKAAAKGIAAFTKMAIAAVKSLVAAIAAGGGVAVAVIVIICLVGLIAGSAFGIFFAGGDMGDGNPALRELVANINQEHTERIEHIKADNPHDDLMLSGSRSPWSEVLAVYSVRTTTDAGDPADALTLDSRRQQMLREVYWSMNAIDSRTEDREVTEIIAAEQEDGTIVEETETYTRRTLYITQSAKTAGETAAAYGFTQKQKDLTAELLTPAYASAWQSVLYSIQSGSGDIVEAAASQIGNVGGQPYWNWYGFASRVEWCACFVSWCANETGYIQAGTVPRFSYCPTGANWFRDAGRWQERGYTPKPGDIIFFDWEQDGITDHVGIVEGCDGSRVRTIEGNSSDAVRRNSYGINGGIIYGYGIQ